MISKSIEDWADFMVSKNGEDKVGTREELIERAEFAVEAKRDGLGCCICSGELWALHYAVSLSEPLCFTCATGEADHSDDYEFEGVVTQ